jgi:Tfp pilus assembly protein PilP
MKLTTGILAVVMTTAAWGQNPNAIANTGSAAKSPQPVAQQAWTKTNQTIAALDSAAIPAKPAAGAPAPAVKPATIPVAKPVTAQDKPAAKSAAASSQNTLNKVNVVRKAEDVQIEIDSREAVTPKVSKLSSPARVVVELPATVMATAQSKIPFGDAGVKDVRIGMDGKTPPTTSVVIDLDKALTYDLTQGAGNKLVLTLHTQGSVQASAKTTATPVTAKVQAPAAKVQTASVKPVAVPQAPATAKVVVPVVKVQTASAKLVVATPSPAPAVKRNPAPATPIAKMNDAAAKKPAASAPVVVAKIEAPKAATKSAVSATTSAAAPATTKIVATEKIAATEKLTVVSKTAEAPKTSDLAPIADTSKTPKQPEQKKWAMNGKRDPFFSPVVQAPTGAGCSTGKKCLEIGQINLRGVVKSESGFIAVVTNTLNKAYFLHENDPVFNGYVMKITGDSVVFQETVQDKLGKPLTREVVKKITTPAV